MSYKPEYIATHTTDKGLAFKVMIIKILKTPIDEKSQTIHLC